MKTILGSILVLFLLTQPLFAEEVRTITVSGSSIKVVKPHYSTLHTQIRVISPSIEGSFSKVKEVLKTINSNLTAIGLEPEDLVASAINQGAEYSWQKSSKILKGYYSNCSLQIKVTNLDNIHKVYNELSKHQAISIGHSEFGRNDKDDLQYEVLQQAIKKAMAKAEAMTAAAGVSLGKVLHIQENSIPQISKRREMLMSSRAADSEQIAATIGSVTIREAVIVEFGLE